jgi:general secretion pathway protein I
MLGHSRHDRWIKKPRLRGFSLLEVLVALAIVAASVIALMSTLNAQVQISQRTSQRAFANMVASNVFANLRLQPNLPPIGKSNGQERSGPYQFAWKMTVTNTDQAGLLRLDVSVSLQTEQQSPVRVITRTEFAARP